MSRIFSGHSRSGSHSRSPSRSKTGETPDLRPGTEAFSAFDGIGAPPQQSDPRPRKTPRAHVTMPSSSEGTRKEMIPVLSLLTAHSARTYQEGYFMLLNDINNEGRPVNNRQWIEVFSSLNGPTLACWDAQALDQGADPKPIYMNITDATFRSVQTLPTGKQGLERIIVVSTTMKNRFLLQFATDKAFSEWTAALRLSQFEHTALQEAYTGALLSSRGSQLNGARALLGGTKTVREDWCNVRFGGGMPWNRCYYVLTPPNLVKDKKQKKRGLGEIAFYESPKTIKKGPLATVTAAFSAYAVFPERAVLVDVSNLIKCHGMVKFSKDTESRESQIFIMPEQHPGIKGYETLIRFIIPLLDSFQLYGRPKRLNADKRDVRSLLFAMPTLPHAYYLDVVDVGMLTALPESYIWGPNQWAQKIKELLARKLASGYTGLGSIHELVNRSKERSESSSEKSQPTIVAKREAPKAPKPKDHTMNSGHAAAALGVMAGLSVQGRDVRALSQPRAIEKGQFMPPQPISNQPHHERSASEGQDRNDLFQPGPYTPPAPNGSSTSFPSSSSSGPTIVATPNGSTSSFRAQQQHSPKHASPLRPPQTSAPYSLDSKSELSSPYTADGEAVYGNRGGQPQIETRQGHYSYAEYSEYMKNYLANGIDEDGNPTHGGAGSPPGARSGAAAAAAGAGAAGARSPPRKAVGPRPQPGHEPPMPAAPVVNDSSTSVASQFATGGPRRGPDQYSQPQNPPVNYSKPIPAAYSSQESLQPAYQNQQGNARHVPAQAAPQSQINGGRSPYGRNPNYSSGNLQAPRGAPHAQDPQSPYRSNSPSGGSRGPAPGGNPYGNPQHQQPQQYQQHPHPQKAHPQQQQQQHSSAHPQQQPPRNANYGGPNPNGGLAGGPNGNPSGGQQWSQHNDVRQAPPMRPRNNDTSPYNIASGQGSYPAFPQTQKPRTRVNGGRPMP